jgi:flagellar biosynthetic protein FlhB
MEASHEPTPRRRQLAREQGHVAKSHDLAAAVLLLAGVGVLLLAGEGIAKFFGQLAVEQLGQTPALTLSADDAVVQWRDLAARLAAAVLPALGLVFAAGVAGHIAQTGFLLQPERLMPDASRVNPLVGAARIFSFANLMHTLQGLAKIAVIVGVTAFCLYDKRGEIVNLPSLPVGHVAVFLCEFLVWTALKIAGALLLLSVLDYLYQRWRYETDLRMTPEELKEEMRLHAIDPQITARRKKLHRRAAAGERPTDSDAA